MFPIYVNAWNLPPDLIKDVGL